ncbi:MFS transporter [Billgrantia saliphila]|uniref:MFS transporter n=1 Tax=Billgrantia saliphila TaxID=1848458 RepID=UPI000CE3C952|nr:MFS transporter [Halomonas saliphila]
MTYHSDNYPAPAVTGAGIREWAGLAVLALPTLLLGLDVTILYLALPAMAVDLQPNSTQALWIMDAYGFMIAGFLITMGTLGDRIGRRRLLLIGALAFATASVIAAYATSATMLIAARAALGVAGATLMPSTLALISNLFGVARQRALAIGIWATMFALGMAAGPVVGGLLLDRFWWGAAFLIAVPVVGVLLVAAPLLLPEHRAITHGRLDLVSVLLSLMAILLAIYGLKEMARVGWAPAPAVSLVTGVGLAILFVRRQYRLAHPLLDMRLFASRTFSAALLVLLIGLIGVAGVMLLVTQYLQLVAGLSPWVAGLWMGPPALMMVAAGIAAPLIARRVRPGHVVAGALALSAPGYWLLVGVDISPEGVGVAVAGFSLVYLGLGTLAALGTDLVVSSAPADRAGSAAAMSEMVQELGVALGVALLGSLATFVYRTRMSESNLDDLPFEVAGVVEEGLWGAVSATGHLPAEIVLEAQRAFTAGLNVTGAIGGIGILALASVAAVFLRHVHALDEAVPSEAAEGRGSCPIP